MSEKPFSHPSAWATSAWATRRLRSGLVPGSHRLVEVPRCAGSGPCPNGTCGSRGGASAGHLLVQAPVHSHRARRNKRQAEWTNMDPTPTPVRLLIGTEKPSTSGSACSTGCGARARCRTRASRRRRARRSSRPNSVPARRCGPGRSRRPSSPRSPWPRAPGRCARWRRSNRCRRRRPRRRSPRATPGTWRCCLPRPW